MTRLIHAVLTLALCLHQAAAIKINIVDIEDAPPPQEGRICAFGDVNKDRYTDLIVQTEIKDKNGKPEGSYLVIQLQSETGRFAENSAKYGRIDIGYIGDVDCVVGDFNGDSLMDIMVTWVSKRHTDAVRYESSVYIYKVSEFVRRDLNMSFVEPPSVMDVNGDGISDVIGFVGDESRLFCMQGSRPNEFIPCQDRFQRWDYDAGTFPRFSPIFADLDGDLGSEIVFGMRMRNHTSSENRLLIQAWKLIDDDFNWIREDKLIKPLPDNWATKQYYGNPVVADFNADGTIDIMLPVCKDETCAQVENLLIWNGERWISLQLDLKSSEIIADSMTTESGKVIHSNVIFRVGDFSLDGYPDVIATVRMNRNGKSSVTPIIIENIEYPDNANFSRKFELKTNSPQLVMPSEMASGRIRMASFFDLKEDGNLDLLVEYTPKGAEGSVRKLDFIKCDDKGDTTFLKVQIFTNVCTNDCPTSTSSELGSGITWHGACVYFTMSDSWGKSRVSQQCQLPQTSQRTLYSPFVLFGLGRSPNFVDEVRMGSPRYTGHPSNQRSVLKQIVPNSRVIIVPPEKDGTHWQSRLYLTPSQLIIQ
ncbi:FG-GAP repeat family protein, partial [Aphelenchoides avenae]